MNIIEKMKNTPLIFDGAMGTEIYKHGVFINTCYDHLNLTNPDLISAIHQSYADAGADVIETNTFGANRIKLKEHGLGDQVNAINAAAVKLARNAIGNDGYVAGSVGPALKTNQLLTPANEAEVAAAFAEQVESLKSAGADCIFLETFAKLDELKLAAEMAKKAAMPVLTSFVVNLSCETATGLKGEVMVAELDQDPNVDAIGINCGIGPSAAFAQLEKLIPHTRKPFTVMPNSGYPEQVDGRMIYMCNPEYFTEYAKSCIKAGARGFGGCCGTTPEDIRSAAYAVKALNEVKKHVEINTVISKKLPQIEFIPFSEKSNLAAKLARGEKVTSIEITPPRSIDMTQMLKKCQKCKDAGIDAINIPDGPRASARISSMVAAMTIEREVGIETVLHYCCRDRNLIGMQSDLLGGYAAGLHNYLVITGDPPKLGDYPDATAVFDVNAVGLTQVVKNLNQGFDVGGNPINPPTGILIGVGANPCAIDMNHEMEHYRNKINAGAEYAITQPVFNPQALIDFMDRAERECDQTIPVIAGVWPLVSYRNALFLQNEVPGVEIPESIMERMAKTTTKEEGRLVGVEIAREIRDAVASRVAGFQVSAPFGIVELALAVLS